jgi:hypothetical protein
MNGHEKAQKDTKRKDSRTDHPVRFKTLSPVRLPSGERPA